MEIGFLNEMSFIQLTVLALCLAIIFASIIGIVLRMMIMNKTKQVESRIKYLAKIDNEKMTHQYLAMVGDAMMVCNKVDKHLAAKFNSSFEAIKAGILYNHDHAWIAEEVHHEN